MIILLIVFFLLTFIKQRERSLCIKFCNSRMRNELKEKNERK